MPIRYFNRFYGHYSMLKLEVWRKWKREKNPRDSSIFFFSFGAEMLHYFQCATFEAHIFRLFMCCFVCFFLPIFLAPVNSPPLSVRNYCDTDVYCTEVGFTYWDRRLTTDQTCFCESSDQMEKWHLRKRNRIMKRETYNAVGIAQTFLKSMKASVQF